VKVHNLQSETFGAIGIYQSFKVHLDIKSLPALLPVRLYLQKLLPGIASSKQRVTVSEVNPTWPNLHAEQLIALYSSANSMHTKEKKEWNTTFPGKVTLSVW